MAEMLSGCFYLYEYRMIKDTLEKETGVFCCENIGACGFFLYYNKFYKNLKNM